MAGNSVSQVECGTLPPCACLPYSAASRELCPNQRHREKTGKICPRIFDVTLGPELSLSGPPAHLLDSHELPGVIVEAQVDTAKGTSTQQLPARPVHRPGLRQFVAVALEAKGRHLLTCRVCTMLR